MTDYRLIQIYIDRARLERSRVLGQLIADGISSLWSSANRFATHASAAIRYLVESPDKFSAALPPRP